MKILLYNQATAKEDWAAQAQSLYLKKISHFFPIEVVTLKLKKLSRDDAATKKEAESKLILENIQSSDYVLLFDEKGRPLNSIEFSKKFELALGSSKKRIIMIIGGAYGVTDEVRQRADWVASLSPLTFNHLLAETVALEQVYRALTIIRNLPYHNS